MWAYQSGAESACLVCPDENVRAALLLRLTLPESKVWIRKSPDFGLALESQETFESGELEICAFALEQAVRRFSAATVIGCFQNTFSYRKILHPRQPSYSLPRLRSDLARQGYRLEQVTGIYPPGFWRWLIPAQLAGTRFPAQYFTWLQRAMDFLATDDAQTAFFCPFILFHARKLDS
jgi:hypothetical protein